MHGRSLIAAILIVIGAITSLVMWQYGHFKAANVDRLGFIKKDKQQLVIQYGQSLFWINAQGEIAKQLDFTQHNFIAKGDYDFFNNGDLLFYHQAESRSFIDKIKAYFRITHHAQSANDSQQVNANKNTTNNFTHSDTHNESNTSNVGSVHQTGWYRCKLAAFSCQPFAVHLSQFPRAFHVVIKQTDNSVFISSTAEHKIIKLNQFGDLQASSSTNAFKFPNQLGFINNELWVADTNNHRLVQLSQETESFASEVSQFTATVSAQNKFPFLFTSDNSSVWVNIAGSQMSHGVIQQYDLTGKKGKKLTPKFVQDPMSVVLWQDLFWLADFDELLIEQFDNEGNHVGAYEPSLFKMINTSRNDVIARGEFVALLGKVAFFVVLLSGFVAAWFLEKKQTINAFTGRNAKLNKDSIEYFIANGKEEVDDEMAKRLLHLNKTKAPFWLTNRAAKYKVAVYIVLAVIALLPCFILLQTNSVNESKLSQLYWFYGVFFAGWFTFIICLLSVFLKIQKVALGVLGESIILKYEEHEISVLAKELNYSNEHLISPTLSIPIGNAKQRYFDKKELNQYVLAQLSEDNKLTPFQTFKALWQQRAPIFMFNVIMVFLACVVVVIMNNFI